MKKGRIVFAAVVIALFLFALVCGTVAYIARTGAYVEEAGRTLSAKASDSLGVPVAIGVGGTLDVMAGVMKRAPRWMQKAKLEWLFRGMLQPKRAGRLLALPKFVLKVHAARK